MFIFLCAVLCLLHSPLNKQAKNKQTNLFEIHSSCRGFECTQSPLSLKLLATTPDVPHQADTDVPQGYRRAWCIDDSCYHLAVLSQEFAVIPAIITEHTQSLPLESKFKLGCKAADHVVSLEQLNQGSFYGKVLLKCGFMKSERKMAEQSGTLSAEKASIGHGNV